MADYERAVAIQRGDAPATTVRELVDAVRQDMAGAGACLSSLTFLAGMHDLPTLNQWVERLGLHLAGIEGKLALAMSEVERDR